MSNCIEIKKSEVVFTPKEFDIEKFLKDKEFHSSISHQESDTRGNTVDDTRANFPLDCTFCWFLRTNSKIDVNGNLHIFFGKGASTHTQRDFYLTIRFLISNYCKGKKRHTFIVYDEYDGFENGEYVEVEFSEGWQSEKDKEDKRIADDIRKEFKTKKFKFVEVKRGVM